MCKLYFNKCKIHREQCSYKIHRKTFLALYGNSEKLQSLIKLLNFYETH